MRTLIVLALVAVLAALAGAGLFMLRRDRSADPGRAPDKRMARALATRVALSIAIFLLVLLAWRMGWIEPRGLPIGR